LPPPPPKRRYKIAFTDLNDSIQGTKYLGYQYLQTYSTIQCQQFCDATDGCKAFIIYFERDPTVNPAAACANPSSLTNIKCALWGQKIDDSLANNTGQYRKDFQVVIAGSNGYNKKTDPSLMPDFDGPVALGGAINAPLDHGYDTYVGMRFFPDTALTPELCAQNCKQTTRYDHDHPNPTAPTSLATSSTCGSSPRTTSRTAYSVPCILRLGTRGMLPMWDSTVVARMFLLARAMCIRWIHWMLGKSRFEKLGYRYT
jgi:hypothetical protein